MSDTEYALLHPLKNILPNLMENYSVFFFIECEFVVCFYHIDLEKKGVILILYSYLCSKCLVIYNFKKKLVVMVELIEIVCLKQERDLDILC